MSATLAVSNSFHVRARDFGWSRSFRSALSLAFGLFLSLGLAGIARAEEQSAALKTKPSPATSGSTGAPTIADAERFMAQTESRLLDLWIKNARASWVMENFITEDTEADAAASDAAVKSAMVDLARQARRFDRLSLPPELARKFKLLRLAVDIPAPRDPAALAELSTIAASLDGDYGKGTWCPGDSRDNCKQLPDIEKILSTSHDPHELLEAWKGWHAVAPPMRNRYVRMVDLANQGAREVGFSDVGQMWRSGYDMPPADFARELDRLWTQLRPLYVSLHAYVRWKLAVKYGRDVVRENEPIPAHLLGNMWAQDWSNIYPLLAPSNAGSGPDITAALRSRNVDAKGLVRYAEGFFTSLGFEPLPATFWERSLFTKPRDREVVCHASASDIDFKEDVRLKACLNPTAEDLVVVHHELGHNFYQRAYDRQPPLFRNSANDGFHEAIGDMAALSVTPEYLKQIGLIDTVSPPSADIGLLLNRALDRLVLLPFTLVVDEWRWKVFSGEIKAADYNKAWWELKRKYQGVAPPEERSEADFDPGAKYHVAANVPYARYFLMIVLQYQFHRALCKEAGYSGPLHRCSIYGSKAAGARLAKMMAMGASRPWPDALEVMTGQRQMDASAMADYYAPLKKWLDEQNAGHNVGWENH